MKEIRALTGLRGIAAVWVLLLHFGDELTTFAPAFGCLEPFYSKGHHGVDLFFVLSGLIITYVYQRVESWDVENGVDFIVKRLARIYPVHLATLLFLALMVTLASAAGIQLGGDYSVGEFFIHLFLLHGFQTELSWNYPSWSISSEFFAYVVIFPISCWLSNLQVVKRYGVGCSFTLLLFYVALNSWFSFGMWSNSLRVSFEFLSGSALCLGLLHSPIVGRQFQRLLPMTLVVFTAICFVPNSFLS
ncbi:MAG: acyltransferase, partial [Planctomycetota bacterium]